MHALFSILTALRQQQAFFVASYSQGWSRDVKAEKQRLRTTRWRMTRLGADLLRCIGLRLRALVYVGVSPALLKQEILLCGGAAGVYLRLLCLPGRKPTQRALQLRQLLLFSYGHS